MRWGKVACVAVPTPEFSELVRLVAERLQRHNRTALTFAVLSALGSVVSWGALYFLVCWLGLLGGTIVKGSYVELPTGFLLGFVAIGCALLFWAWLDRKVTPNALPPDEKSTREIVSDFILAIPRMTLAIAGNLSARQRLTDADVEEAARLLERVWQRQRLAMQETPLEIPDDQRRMAVITALMLLGLLELYHANDGVWLRVSGSEREAIERTALK